MHKPSQQFVSLMAAIREGSPDEHADLLDGYFPYETIKFSGRLKFLDESRSVAVFKRRQRVRFLEDGVGVVFNRIWGEGVLVGSYLAPGLTLMEPIKTRTGYILPLGLPRQFNKGETFEIVTQRRIVAGFSADNGYWDTTLSKPADLIQITVVTPPNMGLNNPEIIASPRGDVHATKKANSLQLRVAHPGVNQPYRLRWSWK